MLFYPESAMERAMKIQEVILRAMAKKITWCQAAEIIGISDRQMRRWYQRSNLWAGPAVWRVAESSCTSIWTARVRYGPHILGRYNAQGRPLLEERERRSRKTLEST